MSHQNFKNYRVKNESGFVIIIALITSTIILAIAIGVLSISLKDYTFSGFTTSSTQALFAADTGLDCALAYDIKTPTFSVPSGYSPNPAIELTRQLDIPIAINTPEALTAIDLNNDGGPMDLAVSGAAEFVVLHNNGNGTFTTNPITDNYSITEVWALSITASDFNGDGYQDLAVASCGNSCMGSKHIFVFKNNGNGTFSWAATVLLGDWRTVWTGSIFVAAGDLNGDGKPELAVANSNSYFGTEPISVARNTSSGGNISFATGVHYSGNFYSKSIALGNLDGDTWPNGDPKLDIVVTKNDSTDGPGVVVLRNTSSVVGGSVTFAPKVRYLTGAPSRTVSIGDINGDGKPDLVVSRNDPTNGIGVFINEGTVGVINFDPIFLYPVVGTSGDFVTTNDLNSDGKLDIAVSFYNDKVSTLRNVDTDTSLDANTFVATTSILTPTANDPRDIAIADFNGDGKPDLATANSSATKNVSMFFNDSASPSPDDCIPGPVTTRINCAGQNNVDAITTCLCTFPPSTTPRTCKTTFNLTTNICVETELSSTYDHKGTDWISDDTETQRIRSRGHNTCDTTNPKRVERALELNYGQ